jgi:hypothetical protein
LWKKNEALVRQFPSPPGTPAAAYFVLGNAPIRLFKIEQTTDFAWRYSSAWATLRTSLRAQNTDHQLSPNAIG